MLGKQSPNGIHILKLRLKCKRNAERCGPMAVIVELDRVMESEILTAEDPLPGDSNLPLWDLSHVLAELRICQLDLRQEAPVGDGG
jgi:hypothetical protein